MGSMRIAVTADLHWGHNSLGDEATVLLAQQLTDNPPDLLLLGGDQGTGDNFAGCLDLFRNLSCPKALVPGNHDLWVQEDDARGDSLDLYERRLPEISAAGGFHYLDQAPLILAAHDLAVVGAINWYDYSWSIERLRAEVPDWQWRLENMAFTRGRHNDRRFVRWPTDDVHFTARVVEQFRLHLEQALAQVAKVIVLTHHPAAYDLSFPREGPPSVPDGLLWDAFAGNAALPALLERHAGRSAAVFCGHTHRARAALVAGSPGYNIGGDYRWKRLIEFAWPSGQVEFHEFGDKP